MSGIFGADHTDADERDADATHRDDHAAADTRDLDDCFAQLRRQILDHLTWIDSTAIDPADWPDLPPAALDRLRAHLDEHRRRTARERAVALTLLTDLHALIHHGRADRHAAASDRRTAAQDRQASAQDRRSAAQDRDDSARDRDQATIEREQANASAGENHERLATGPDESLVDRAAQAIGESRHRIADSRVILIHSHDDTG
jgi:hypothetical protein